MDFWLSPEPGSFLRPLQHSPVMPPWLELGRTSVPESITVAWKVMTLLEPSGGEAGTDKMEALLGRKERN